MVLAVVAFACGGAQVTAPAPQPTTSVLDAGAAPRRVVRRELPAHVPERAELTVKTRATTDFTNTVLETGHRLLDLPTVKATARNEVIGANAGAVEVASVIEDVSVLDDVVDAAVRVRVEKEAAAAKGKRTVWHQTPSGAITDIEGDVTSVKYADALRQSAVVFPDVEIGVGASWQVTSELHLSNVNWHGVANYHLKALDDSAATVIAEVVLTASPQALHVEPNASTKVTSGTASLTAELIVPLHALAMTGTVHSTSEINLQIVRGHLRIASTSQTEMAIALNKL